MKGANVLLPKHRGGLLTDPLKVWELHWSNGAGKDAFCSLEAVIMVRPVLLMVLSGESL